MVRYRPVGGAPIDGHLIFAFDDTLTPFVPLQADTTYEVILARAAGTHTHRRPVLGKHAVASARRKGRRNDVYPHRS